MNYRPAQGHQRRQTYQSSKHCRLPHNYRWPRQKERRTVRRKNTGQETTSCGGTFKEQAILGLSASTKLGLQDWADLHRGTQWILNPSFRLLPMFYRPQPHAAICGCGVGLEDDSLLCRLGARGVSLGVKDRPRGLLFKVVAGMPIQGSLEAMYTSDATLCNHTGSWLYAGNYLLIRTNFTY